MHNLELGVSCFKEEGIQIHKKTSIVTLHSGENVINESNLYQLKRPDERHIKIYVINIENKFFIYIYNF